MDIGTSVRHRVIVRYSSIVDYDPKTEAVGKGKGIYLL